MLFKFGAGLGHSGPFWALLSRSGPSWAALSRSNLIPLRFHYENHNSRLIPVLELAEAMRCSGNVRNLDKHAYQAPSVLWKRPKPWQEGLSDASRHILGASDVVLEMSETPAGMLIRHFAFPLGCASGSF